MTTNGGSWVTQRTLALQYSRAFRLFLVGRAVSHTGTGAHAVAVGWVVWQITTGDPLALGLVLGCQFAPQLCAGPVLGALVDRWPRHRAMLIQQTCALMLAALMATLVLTDMAQLWVIYLLMLGVGLSTAASNPLQQALLGEMVPSGPHRQSAVALNSVTFQAGSLAGAGLAALLLPLLGAGAVMLISPTTYLIAITTLALIRARDLTLPTSPPGSGPGTTGLRRLAADIAFGLSHMRATPELRTALVLSAAVSVLGMGALQTGAQTLVMSNHASTPARDAVVLGWATAAVSLGGIAAQIHVAGACAPTLRTLARYVTALALGLIGAAVVGFLPLVLAMVAVSAWMAYGHQTLAQVVLHRAPEHLKGRVSGWWFAVGSGGKALAGPTAGLLATLLGPGAGMLTAGLLLAAVALGVLALQLQRRSFPTHHHRA